jgi:hypothetical protein
MIYNVRDYGALGNGTADDTAAFVAVLAAVAAGGSVLIPAGSYNIFTALSQNITGTVSLVGEGSGASVLNFLAATDGIALSLQPTAGNVHMRGLTIYRAPTSPAYANVAISISTSSAQGPRFGNPIIQDLQIMGDLGGASGWDTGILINNVSNITINDVLIKMPNANGSGIGKGISLTGLSSSSYLVECCMNNITTVGGGTGLLIGNWIQGVYVVNSRFIGNDYGIYWPGVGGDSDIALMVANTHCNSSTRGVLSTNGGSYSYTNMIMLHFGTPSLTGDWAAFEIDGSNNGLITNNNIASGAPGFAGVENGVKLVNGSSSIVAGNTINTKNTSIVLGSMSATMVSGNVATISSADPFISDMPAGIGSNQKSGNQRNGIPDLTFDGANVVCPTGLTVGQNGGSASMNLGIKGGVNTNRHLMFETNDTPRWFVGADGGGHETGGDAGCDFVFISVNDAGSVLTGTPLRISRKTGVVTWAASPTYGSPIVNAVNDAAALTANVPIGGTYRNGSALMVRVT